MQCGHGGHILTVLRKNRNRGTLKKVVSIKKEGERVARGHFERVDESPGRDFWHQGPYQISLAYFWTR